MKYFSHMFLILIARTVEGRTSWGHRKYLHGENGASRSARFAQQARQSCEYHHCVSRYISFAYGRRKLCSQWIKMLFADIPPTSVVLRHPKKDKVQINIERNIRVSILTDNDLVIYTGNQSNPPNTTHHAAMAHLKSKEVVSNSDFCETLISISKLRLSRKTLVSFSISALNFVLRTLIVSLNFHSQTLKKLRHLD